MAAPTAQEPSREEEVQAALNELRQLNLLHAADKEAISEVITDYFTSRDAFDSDDDVSELDDDDDFSIEDMDISDNEQHGSTQHDHNNDHVNPPNDTGMYMCMSLTLILFTLQ